MMDDFELGSRVGVPREAARSAFLSRLANIHSDQKDALLISCWNCPLPQCEVGIDRHELNGSLPLREKRMIYYCATCSHDWCIGII